MEKICIRCGNKYVAYGRRKKTAKYCSKSCAKIGITPANKGKHLSKEHKLKISLANKGRISPRRGMPRDYVPKSAFKKGHKPWNYIDGKAQERGNARLALLGKEWENIRQAVIIRDNFSCQHCGNNSKLEVHHKIPYRLTKDHSLSNLLCLCNVCHRKEDMRLLKSLKRIGGDPHC